MNEHLPRVTLGKNLEISRVVTGLWQIADMERNGSSLDPEVAAAAMVPYAEAGLTTFDMADHYGSAEVIAGTFQRKYGASHPVELLTKWVPEPGVVTKDGVRAAVERSLERLASERIDLLQFHAWRYADLSWLDCLIWLQEIKDEGLIGEVGVTNFDTAHLLVALETGIELASNQVCYSLLDQRPAGAMTRLCQRHGVALLAYGSLAGGFLSDRWLGAPDPGMGDQHTWSQMKYRRFIGAAGGWKPYQASLAAVKTTAQRLGVSVANVASRFILERPAVAAVIVGARLGESEHIDENLGLFQFELDATARHHLHEARSLLEPLLGDSGDEYRKPPFLTASGDLRHHLQTFPAPYEVQHRPDGRLVVSSGTRWEELAGFCRALREGERILVAGTTATQGQRTVGGSDAAAQFHFIVDKIEAAIISLGGRLNDIVRTRVFVKRLEDWEAVARAHGHRFGDILPVNTLVQADLVGDDYLVEVEAEALLGNTEVSTLIDHE